VEQYNEYLERVNWEHSSGLHHWVAKRLMLRFARFSKLSFIESEILEIGVGTGRIADTLYALKVKKFVGVEPNARLAEFTRRMGFDVNEYALPSLPNNWEDFYSAVVSFHVLEHAPTYIDARLWIKEMARVTKPGGYILIAAPDIRNSREYFWDSDWSHGFPTTPRRVSQIGDDLNLTTVYAGNFALGNTHPVFTSLARLIDKTLPTRLLDAITMKLVKRPLASGLKIALLWGLTFVVFEKPSN